jgi:hypothetical protein
LFFIGILLAPIGGQMERTDDLGDAEVFKILDQAIAEYKDALELNQDVLGADVIELQNNYDRDMSFPLGLVLGEG